MTKQAVIIDTDMGSDDWMAILYLLKQPTIDVRAIILDGNGLADLAFAKKNIQYLLALANYTKPILIGEGKKYSLIGDKQFPAAFRQASDQLFNLKEASVQETSVTVVPARYAYDKILTEAKTPVSILAIGPLTTLAKAFQQNPLIKKHIKRIVILGGAVHVDGNVADFDPKSQNHVAEWNFYIDPLAAQIVLQSGVPITLIPLDATNQVPLDQTVLSQFKQQQPTPITHFLTKLLKTQYFSDKAALYYFWDPLAAGILVHPEYATTHAIPLVVNTNQGRNWAQVKQSQHGHKTDVVLGVGSDAFIQDFVETLSTK